MRSFTPKILLEIEDKGNVQFANCDHNACCYIRFLIYLREVWLKLFDLTERELKLRETEIATDIKNNKYDMASVEHEIKHMNDVRLFMTESRPIIVALQLGTWCWDYPDDSTVLPISRYRRSKATLLLLSTGVQLTYDLLSTVGVTSIFTNRYLLQSNYKT